MAENDNGNGRKQWVVNTAISLVGVAAVVCGSVWAFSADRTEVTKDVQANQTTIADHELRLRAIEKQLTKIQADVSWIRETMEATP